MFGGQLTEEEADSLTKRLDCFLLPIPASSLALALGSFNSGQEICSTIDTDMTLTPVSDDRPLLQEAVIRTQMEGEDR